MTDGDAPQFGRVPYQPIDAGAVASMKPADARVYLVLCAHGDQYWRACLGIRRIAQLAGVHIGTVSAAVCRLKTAGMIETNDPGNGSAYQYRILTNRSAPCERLTVQRCANGKGGDRSAHDDETVQRSAKNRSACAEQNRVEQRENRGAQRKRDPLWDAVVHHFGLRPVTKSEKSRVGRVVRELRAKGAEPDDVGRRIERYRAAWPNITCTLEALLKHWDAFAEPAGILDADPVEPPDEVFMDE